MDEQRDKGGYVSNFIKCGYPMNLNTKSSCPTFTHLWSKEAGAYCGMN